MFPGVTFRNRVMKFFVDTADVKEIQELASTGLLDGVTTNPSLIAKSGRPFLDVIKEICAIVEGPVSAEVTATDHKTMLAEGHKLAKLAANVCVKVPLTVDGLKTCKVLSSEGTKVNVTLCFSAAQALLAAKAGATFISPFVGRLDDIGQDGMELIAEDRGAGRLRASSGACHRCCQDGRRCRHPAARDPEADVQSPADR
jgi:transaldolase